tara:strand:- start:117073 stop:118515 length:1443 start_codon:yes stop_codon:yes gene_type:complete
MTLKSKSTALNIKLEDLILDVNNPRFAELYNGSKAETDLIEYLLYTEAAEDVAKGIVKAGEFYPDKSLWVIKTGKKYLVKDGNRRCAAVKALQMPSKYKLDLPKTVLNELPVLLYKKQSDIDERIVEEHAGSLFRRWERIAKALEILKLSSKGKWDDVRELDSKPGDLIKLATFYKEAVVYGGDDLRQLLRRGRGKTGGKTIIFERLFRDSKACGYQFKRSPSFKIDIKNSAKFKNYVLALVKYLKAHPETTTETIDKDRSFIKKLKDYGFDPNKATSVRGAGTGGSGGKISKDGSSTKGTPVSTPLGTGAPASGNPTSGKSPGRGSVKKTPTLKRKGLPPGLKSRVQEYFEIDPITQPNSKIAMARITFECVLKYVIENTKFNTKTAMSKSGFFGAVYSKKFADFTLMKSKFTQLILNIGDQTAFDAFDLNKLHVIVHNYKVNGISTNAEQISNNLLGLIEFMLQDEKDLLTALDISKL